MKIDQITNETIFTIDWAKDDPRSVKAYLDGRGDGRTLWWRINHAIHRSIQPGASMEDVMYSFHSRHGKTPLFFLKLRLDVKDAAVAICSRVIRLATWAARSQ
jgi:hypothetical protein